MQSKFQSNKLNFRVNFFLDCILDEIFAVYEFYFFNSLDFLLRKNDKLIKLPFQSGLCGPSDDTVSVCRGPRSTIYGLMDPSF